MPIIHVTLKRKEDTKYGTFGELYIVDERICYTLEPPWKDNQENVSCIPIGSYIVAPHWSPKHSPKYGMVLKIHGVPEREEILVHPGNWLKNTLGCILPGLRRDDTMVKDSVKVMDKLMSLIGETGCILTITEDYKV